MRLCISMQHCSQSSRLEVEVNKRDEKIPLYGVYLDVDVNGLREAGDAGADPTEPSLNKAARGIKQK